MRRSRVLSNTQNEPTACAQARNSDSVSRARATRDCRSQRSIARVNMQNEPTLCARARIAFRPTATFRGERNGQWNWNDVREKLHFALANEHSRDAHEDQHL
jgi:hypothetical protein